MVALLLPVDAAARKSAQRRLAAVLAAIGVLMAWQHWRRWMEREARIGQNGPERPRTGRGVTSADLLGARRRGRGLSGTGFNSAAATPPLLRIAVHIMSRPTSLNRLSLSLLILQPLFGPRKDPDPALPFCCGVARRRWSRRTSCAPVRCARAPRCQQHGAPPLECFCCCCFSCCRGISRSIDLSASKGARGVVDVVLVIRGKRDSFVRISPSSVHPCVLKTCARAFKNCTLKAFPRGRLKYPWHRVEILFKKNNRSGDSDRGQY